jgi:hypothetical protein
VCALAGHLSIRCRSSARSVLFWGDCDSGAGAFAEFGKAFDCAEVDGLGVIGDHYVGDGVQNRSEQLVRVGLRAASGVRRLGVDLGLGKMSSTSIATAPVMTPRPWASMALSATRATRSRQGPASLDGSTRDGATDMPLAALGCGLSQENMA